MPTTTATTTAATPRKPGRPKGSTNKRKAKRTVKPIEKDTDIKTYTCVCCGAQTEVPTGRFYKSQSAMYRANGGYVPFCVKCLQTQFEEFRNRYGEKQAMILICHYTDMPFFYSAYDSVIHRHDTFRVGMYFRLMNHTQYSHKTFIHTLLEKRELQIEEKVYEATKEGDWPRAERLNKASVLRIMGHDPFEGYSPVQRRFLFNNIIGYLNEDGIEDDTFKLSQIVQLVNNNYQINQIDIALAKLNALSQPDDMKVLQAAKKTLVDANDKIAKENGVSVKNRMNAQAGQGTLTYLQRYLRELNIPEAESNYYDQLRSEGTQWAATMSFKAIKENGFFDENDTKDILEKQYVMINQLQTALDEAEEKNRLMLIELDKYKKPKKKTEDDEYFELLNSEDDEQAGDE